MRLLLINQKELNKNISIHAPIVGCDSNWSNLKDFIIISIHAPIVGCDKADITLTINYEDFNPRTHRGVRQYYLPSLTLGASISIHAPIVGCDIIKFRFHFKILKFQSTHPSWGATLAITNNYFLPYIFQSTHPSWGATLLLWFFINHLSDFNPRTHRGVRRLF